MTNSSLLICGIDPGKKGAIAFLEPTSMSLIVHDMPRGKSSTGKDEIDFLALGKILAPQPGYDRYIAMVEKVATQPRDGHVGAFTFGQGYGALRMGVVCHGYEDHYVTPTVWKKHFRLSSDKGVSLTRVRSRFPAYAGYFAREMDHNRAEAALIALYAAETLALTTLLNPTA